MGRQTDRPTDRQTDTDTAVQCKSGRYPGVEGWMDGGCVSERMPGVGQLDDIWGKQGKLLACLCVVQGVYVTHPLTHSPPDAHIRTKCSLPFSLALVSTHPAGHVVARLAL
mmetsp:Transcript_33733/g.97291  ORF Transcript_33733/g.97291 Transcript_33733/m.97291 type:complete len:111 (+) Transcript_33733:554-886(+)